MILDSKSHVEGEITSSSMLNRKEKRDASSDEQNLLLKHRAKIAEKLKLYESECHRYEIQKVVLIQKCLMEEVKQCNLESYGVGSLQCQVMFNCFAANPSTPLTAISLKNNQINETCFQSMIHFIQTNGTLQVLNLESSKFGDEPAIILAEGISVSTSIVTLNLSNCNISDEAGEFLVNSLLSNFVLKELNLSFNTLSLKTALAFTVVLKENKTLQSLDLSHNNFCDENAVDNIIKGLSENKSLHHLNLSWNSLSGENFGTLLSKSIKLSKLTTLNLEHNQLKSFEIKKLTLGLKKSQTIREVHIADNEITEFDEIVLLKVFYSKSSLELMSFGKWFQLSHGACKMAKEIRIFKPHVKIIFQGVLMPNPPTAVNMLDIYADRAKFLAMTPKKVKQQRNMGDFMNQLNKLQSSYLSRSNFLIKLKKFKAKLDDSLVEQYIAACMVHVDGQNYLNVHLMANHYLNRHPHTAGGDLNE